MYLRPNQQRGKTAILFLWIMLGLEILNMVSSYMQINLLNSVNITEEAAEANDNREAIVGFLYAVGLLATAVVFLRWFRRAYFNLRLKVQVLNEPDSWTLWAWIVPILSLFKPYQLMKEMYVKTRQYLEEKQVPVPFQYGTEYVGWWWTLWIVSALVQNIESPFFLETENVQEMISASYIGMISGLIGIPLCFLAIKVIRDYARMETLLVELEIEDEKVLTNPEW